MPSSIEKWRKLAAGVLVLLALGVESPAQGGATGASKIRTASFRTWEPGLFDPPTLPPTVPWAPGDAPDVVRVARPVLRDGALGSAAVAVGEFRCEAIDLVVPGRGPAFVLARRYRNRSRLGTSLGPGWTHAYDLRIQREGPDLRLQDGWGENHLFSRNPDGSYTAPGWFAVATELADGSVQLRLGPFSNSWVFSDPDGSQASAGRIARIEDEHGNALSFSYEADGDLVQVLDTLGRTFDFVHDAQHRLASVTDFAGRVVRYDYYDAGEEGGSGGDLAAVTSPAVVGTPTGNDFPDGKTTRYTYTSGFADAESNHNLLTIRNPDGSLLLRNRYGAGPTQGGHRDWLVRQWLAPDQHDIQLHYSFWPSGLRCIVNDDVGNVREYGFDEVRGRILVRQWAGRADPDLPTTPTRNRPTGPLRPLEESFLTTVRLNADGCISERRMAAHGDSRVERFLYESDVDPDVDPARRGNLVQRSWGGGEMGAPLLREVFGYDRQLGVLTSRTLPGGETTTFVRDPQNGDLLQVRHAEPGVVEDFEYNSFGQRTAHVLPDNGNGQRRRDELYYYTGGPWTGYLYLFVENSDHAPSVCTYAYDDVGNPTSITDPLGNTTQRFVNDLNQVVRVQAPDLQLPGLSVGATMDFRYDLNDRCVQVDVENRDENGALDANTHWTTSLSYDARGRLVSRAQEVGPGQVASTDWSFLPGRTVVRLPRYAAGARFHVLALDYDERGLLFRRTRAMEHPTDQTTTQWDYDPFRAVARVSEGIEGTPRETLFTYDAYGRLVRTDDAMGNARSFEYDDNGNHTRAILFGELVDVTGAAGNVRLAEQHWQYDDMNRLVAYQADSFDPSTQMPQHDGAYHFLMEISGTGAVMRVTDDAGETWEWVRDLTQRSTTRTDPTGQTVQRFHDASGNVVQVVENTLNQRTGMSEVYATAYVYDEWNRRIRAQDTQQNAWETRYDSRSLPVVQTGPSGAWKSCSFDGRGKLLREEVDLTGNGQGGDPGDRTTSFIYDVQGNLLSRMDANGNTTVYAYDALDRRIQRTHADGSFWTWTHDVFDDPVLVRDGNGSLRSQQFDALGRLTVRTVQPGTGVSPDTSREDFAYDGRSLLTVAADDDSSVSLVHSSLGHLLSETVNGATTLSSYDASGRLVDLTYPSGRRVLFQHDALGRITRVVEAADDELVSELLYAEQRVVRRDLCNGVRSDYDFDGIGNATGDLGVRQLEGAQYYVPGGPVIADLQWSYQGDQALSQHFDGRLLSAEDLHRDPASRLEQWDLTLGTVTSTVQYGLDGLGNRTLVTGGPDAGSYFMDPTTPDPADFQQSQYTATPFDTRTYDDNGNLLQQSDAAGTRQYVHDYRGRQVEWTDAATGLVHRYGYDALGRMIIRVHDVNGTAETVQMRYRRSQLLEEEGATLFTYTYEGEARHAFERRGGPSELYYLADRGNTVRAVVDEQADVVEYYDYDPFGVATVRDELGNVLPGSRLPHTPMFLGMRWHEELGLYREGHSLHDPRTDRAVDGIPGSSSGDGSVVDGNDFLAWQRGTVPGDVDGHDFSLWQSGASTSDASTNGAVDGDDFLVWQRQFGSAGVSDSHAWPVQRRGNRGLSLLGRQPPSSSVYGQINLERGFTSVPGIWPRASAWVATASSSGEDLLLVNDGDGSDPSASPPSGPLNFHTSCSSPDSPIAPMSWDSVANVPWQSSSSRAKRPPLTLVTWGERFSAADGGIVIGRLWNGSGPSTSAYISRSDVIFDIVGASSTPARAAFGNLVLKRGVVRYDDDGDLDLYLVNAPGGDNAGVGVPGLGGVVLYSDLDLSGY